jgi:Leucine-rich repeat (LRR) protein
MRAAVPNAQDRALEKFWNFIKSTTNRRLPHLRNAAEIRAWVEQTQEFFSKNEYLNCDKIKLDLLPVEIGLFTSLKTLILSFNWLGTLPSEIGQLKNLESLDVSFNALKTLPSEIGHCKKLTNLNFSNNLITFLPPEIGQLTDLKVLRAFNNRIKKFPPEICSCGFPGSTSLLSIYLLCSKNNVDPKTLKNLFSEFVKNQKKSRPEAFLHIIADNFENQFYAQVWAQSDKPQTLDQLQWGKEHAFDNISNFQKAIVETVSHQIRNFLFKNKVFDVIYQLAGSPNTNESNWGEKHAFENPERLIQAYELVRNHVVILNVS